MTYEQHIYKELVSWQRKMDGKPSIIDHISTRVQKKVNSYIPEKVHRGLTAAIKQMVRGVLFGATYTTKQNPPDTSLLDIEMAVHKRIEFYKKAAAVEGGVTGAGGILLGLADFPLLLSLKLKLLFDIAGLYGYSVKDYKERLYVLNIFQLAFSSQKHRRTVYHQMQHWDTQKDQLPEDINQFEWRSFQQEYRDHIDLVKMAQLIPGIGAVVGFVVNYRLLKKLGRTAMNAYRMRKLQQQKLLTP
ncbi:MAG TPA: EcsC family protein [Chitinophagaceae bacterium]|jgi:hypothetical protein|nr:EcsC family protein [Chitinophagaceae bacterium]